MLENPTLSGRKRGRPKDAHKREAILDATLALFRAYGLEGVGLEAVAAKAGVTRKTVYNHFGSKFALLEVALLKNVQWGETDLAALQNHEQRDIESLLKEFGRERLMLLFQPDMQALDLFLVKEVQHYPEFAARLYEQGALEGLKVVAHFIELAVAGGELDQSTDPVAAAEDFLSLLMGMASIKARLGLTTPLADAEARKRAAHAAHVVVLANRQRSSEP